MQTQSSGLKVRMPKKRFCFCSSFASTSHEARHRHCLGSDNRLCFQYLCPLALTDTVVVPARKSPLPHGKPRGGSGVVRTVQAPPQDVGVKPAHLLGPGSPQALHTLAGTREPATRHTHHRGPVQLPLHRVLPDLSWFGVQLPLDKARRGRAVATSVLQMSKPGSRALPEI